MDLFLSCASLFICSQKLCFVLSLLRDRLKGLLPSGMFLVALLVEDTMVNCMLICKDIVHQELNGGLRNTVRGREFPGSSVSKESTCSAGDLGLIPGLGRSPGEGNGKPLEYPCLENLMDRGASWAAVHGVAKSQTRLSD